MEWIKISEQSPEEDNQVLICCRNGYIYITWPAAIEGFNKLNEKSPYNQITHWMKLPERPKDLILEKLFPED